MLLSGYFIEIKGVKLGKGWN